MSGVALLKKNLADKFGLEADVAERIADEWEADVKKATESVAPQPEQDWQRATELAHWRYRVQALERNIQAKHELRSMRFGAIFVNEDELECERYLLEEARYRVALGEIIENRHLQERRA
jgi:hypothetical protein